MKQNEAAPRKQLALLNRFRTGIGICKNWKFKFDMTHAQSWEYGAKC